MKVYKRISLIVLAIIMILTITGCNNNKDQKVIAEYKDGKVIQSEFDIYIGVANFFEPGLNEYLNQSDATTKNRVLTAYLETYIGEKYLAAQIKDDKSLKDKADFTLDLIKEQYIEGLDSEQEYNQNLQKLNITEADIYDYLMRFYKAEEYFVTKKYEEDKQKFAVATVSHILISNEGRTDNEARILAEEVLRKLKAGENFATMAKDYSDDPGSKDEGGTYEDVPVAFWVKEFQEATISLPLNELSELVQTYYGYHIILVTERDIPSLEEVSGEVRNVIFSEEYSDFMDNELSSIIKKINL